MLVRNTAVFVLLFASQCAATEVQFRARASVSGRSILLGEIAEISSDLHATQRSLARVNLGPVPARATVFDTRMFAARINALGYKAKFAGASRIIIEPGGKTQRALPAKVTQQRYALAVRRSLPAGHLLTQRDLAWKPVAKRSRYELSINDAIGRQLRRGIAAGDMLQPSNLQRVLMIRAGDSVSVVFKKGGINVRSEYIARSSGGFGDSVKLLAKYRKSVITATVIGFKRARIEPAADMTADPNIRFVKTQPRSLP